MESKNKNTSLFSYFSYLYFAVIFLMSAYICYKNLALGITSFLVLIVLVLIYLNKKKMDLKKWRDRVQSASFNFSNLTKKSLLNLPIPLCILEMDGTISWANKYFDQMIGLEEGSTSIGDNLEDIVGELTLAINSGVTVSELEGSTRAHPTFYEAVTEALAKLIRN